MNVTEPDTKTCKQCCLPIPLEAKISTHCQSHQDWRGFFSISNTVLALLTALVSVLSIAIPNLYGLMHRPKSDMAAPMISMEGTTVRVLVNNRGDAAGVFVRADVRSEYLAGATKVRLRDDQRAVIGPGTNLLMFDIIPLLTQDESYRNSVEMIELVLQDKGAPPTDIIFQFGDSDGIPMITRLSLDANKLFELMRANSDRCSAVKVADFYNGCIGPGAALDSASYLETLKDGSIEQESKSDQTHPQAETASPLP
ncbi:hypothetical protein [Neorhizobium sp. T25_13]|uniref:hypothetical protein n=1 Tax=Neorhizobium sp. T25_13 TaxID=2093830 RepID=UPI00197B7BC9|nr:hypothetical protein [Neorhizobium sp. T25_13]